MEMLSQIQVRKSEAFSYISFSASEIGGGRRRTKKKKKIRRDQTERANDRARERGSVMGLCSYKGDRPAGKVVQ